MKLQFRKPAALAALAAAGSAAAIALTAGAGQAAVPTTVASVSGYLRGTETLTWAPAANVSGYNLYRDNTLVGTAPASATSAKFSVSGGQQHTLRVDTIPAPPRTTSTTSTTTTTTVPTTTSVPTTTTTPRPAVAPIGTMALGDTLNNQSSHLSSYSYIVFSSGDDSLAAAQHGLALVYTSPTAITSQWDDPGISYAQASANGWLLKDAGGAYVHPYNDSSEYLTDIGSAAEQQSFVSQIVAYLAAHPGVDGIELDNTLPDVQYFNSGKTWPAKYPNAQAWQDAEVAFVTAVGKTLRAKGIYVMANATGFTNQSGYDSGQFDQGWYQRLAQTGGLDALFAEQWLQNPNSVSQLMDNTNPGSFMTSWAGWQQLEAVCNQYGVAFFAGLQGTSSATNTMRFGRGSFLLDWNGTSGMMFYSITPAYGGPDAWNAAWTTSIGTPTAPKSQPAANVWYRPYSGGFVVVNAGGSTWTGTVGGATYTVPARDALIHSGS